MSHLTEARAEVERLKTVRASNKALLQLLADKIEQFVHDPAELTALVADLRGEVDGIASDVVAHTPSEVEPDEPVVPDEPIPEPEPESFRNRRNR